MPREQGSGSDEIVEQMGSWFSGLGVQRSAGQLFGHLMVCEPAEQSAADISHNTGLSPASVSSGTRLLVQMNAVEQRHRVGDRKTYYRLRSDFWMHMALAKLRGFEQLAIVGQRVRAGGGLARTDGVDEMIEFAEFWQGELPKVVERWEERRQSQEEEA
ncbi:MAG: hypothetical protein U9O18_02290 [Chloroflexota bacterium]|nr:hypothetical protein [Chloroflexota bacterium]